MSHITNINGLYEVYFLGEYVCTVRTMIEAAAVMKRLQDRAYSIKLGLSCREALKGLRVA